MDKKIINLEIIEELEESGVSAISLVDQPAINKNFLYFREEQFVEPRSGESEDEFVSRCIPLMIDEGKPQDQAVAMCYSMWRQNMSVDTSSLPPYIEERVKDEEDLVIKVEFESYTDYPEGATNNAKRAIEWKEKNGSDCGTQVGWTRARQLADRKPISEETIARMASFERHRQNSDTPYSEGCGGIMWDAWGGDSGISWAQTKLKEIRGENMQVEMAAIEDLKVGDPVSWKTADQNPRGRIREIVKRRRKVPGTDFFIEGTEDDPGYLIEIYEKVNGKWEGTGKYVGRKAGSILKNVELWRQIFASEEEKILVGPALIPDVEIFRRGRDKKEDYYVRFSKETVAKIAEKFMRDLNGNNTNVQHTKGLPADTYIFESWLVEDPETDKANTVYNQGVGKGTWMVKARVENPNVWKLIKDGKINGFSIEGNFLTDQEYQEYLKDKKTYEDLKALVQTFKD